MAQFLGGIEHLEGLAVGDHVQRCAAQDGYFQDHADIFRLADDDVAVESGIALDLALARSAGAGDDCDEGGHAVDVAVACVDLVEELVEGGAVDDVRGRVLRTVCVCTRHPVRAGVRASSPSGGGLSNPHEHKLQVYLPRQDSGAWHGVDVPLYQIRCVDRLKASHLFAMGVVSGMLGGGGAELGGLTDSLAVGSGPAGVLFEGGGEAAVALGVGYEVEVVGVGGGEGGLEGGDAGVADGAGRQAGVAIGVVGRVGSGGRRRRWCRGSGLEQSGVDDAGVGGEGHAFGRGG